MYYKLTDKNMRTYHGFQWELNKWVETSGEGELCTNGWIHIYNHPILAILLNPIHANFTRPRLFEIETDGKMKEDMGLKFGVSKVRLIKELPLPLITPIQQTAFAILCAQKVYNNQEWNVWAQNWLNGIDRSAEAAAWTAAQAVAEAAWTAVWAAWTAVWAAQAATEVAEATAQAAWATQAAAQEVRIDLIAIAEEAMKVR